MFNHEHDYSVDRIGRHKVLLCLNINCNEICDIKTKTQDIQRFFGRKEKYACEVYCPVRSEFTQQDGRKKRTAKCLSVTNLTWLLLVLFVVIFSSH